MQRNMDLVRTILMRIEESPSGWATHPFGIAGFTPEQVGYHAHIMMEDGLLEGVDVTSMHSESPGSCPRIVGSCPRIVAGGLFPWVFQQKSPKNNDLGTPPSPEAMPRALTWKGHEFLDLARDQKRWNQAKALIGKVGSAPLAVWTKVLNDLVLKELRVVSQGFERSGDRTWGVA